MASTRIALCLVALSLPAVSCQGSQTDSQAVSSQVQALTFTESNGLVSIEAENFTSNTAQGAHSWALQSDSGAAGASMMVATPDNGAANNTGYTSSSPRLDYQVTFAQAGTYRVWVRGRAGGSATATSDSVHVGLNGAAVSSADRISSFSNAFGWSQATMDGVNATLDIPAAGQHTVNVWMREDGFDFDKLVLTQDANFTPTGMGPAETPDPGGNTCSPVTYEAENMDASTGGSVSGGWNIWSNGDISTTHNFTAGAASLTVFAQGTSALGVWPTMVVSIGGTQIGQVTVDSTSWTPYTFPFDAAGTSQTISVAFTNDYYDEAAGEDRNLLVDKVVVDCPVTDVCSDGDTQTGTTACGLNGRGAFEQQCVDGAWQDTTDCIDPDECVDDATRPSGTSCGLNDRGSVLELCVEGSWTTSAICDDPDECVDDATQPGTTACGVNGRGALDQLCVVGAWQDTSTCVDPDVCTDDATRSGTTPCGYNGRGTLDEQCVAGQWQDTQVCQDPDECQDNSTQPGSTPCGINGRGVLQQLCSLGTWEDTALCLDPDVCMDGQTQAGTTACGLNGRGALDQACVAGQWQDTAVCQDPDQCVDGSTQPGSGSCGLNGRGTLLQVCVAGSWEDSSSCDDPDECIDDSTQPGTTACGLNNRGALDQLCVVGSWTDTSTCVDPDECVDGATQPGSTACGLNNRGTFDEVCTNGNWQDSSVCNDPDECVDGTTQPGTTACGDNGTLDQLCSAGQWVDSSTCVEAGRCGDDICGGTEDCGSCATDCGACQYPVAVYLEAELGSLSGSPSFNVVADAAAAGGAYLEPTSNNTASPGPNRADYDFAVEAGTYKVWLRARATSYSTDSLWLSMDGASFIRWNNFPQGGFVWDDAQDSDNGDSVVSFELSAGVHTLTLANRESGLSIDKFYITSSGDTPSGQGGNDGVCGDALCMPSEDCSSCASDCGSCIICTDGETQPGTTSCGLNGRGVLEQACVGGDWADSSVCLDPDECVDGDTQTGTQSCGLNGRGTLDEVCVTGHWQSSVCNDPDVCVDGDSQSGTTPCGNGGVLEQLCTSGQWVDGSTCIESMVCGDGLCGPQEDCSSCAIDCGICSQLTAVYLEAESGSLYGSPGFNVASNSGASGGEYLEPTSNDLASPGPNRADYDFSVAAGTYSVWVRGNAASANDDSVWLSMDGGAFIRWNDFPAGGWVWGDARNSDAGGNAVTFTLSAGSHTLTLANREDGFLIDKLYITSAGDTPSGEGNLCGDAICGGNENCSSCESDCGTCPHTPEFLGCALNGTTPSSWDGYFDQATAENGCKWGVVESSRNVMNWSGCDQAYNHTRSRGIPFRFHAFFWGQQEPSWLAGLSNAEQLVEVEQWLSAAAQRYPGAEMIDVVNEPLHETPAVADALGGTGTTGWDWVVEAFRRARAHFPSAKLMPNDYSLMGRPNDIATYLTLVDALKAADYQGAPIIDGLGIQSHYFNVEVLSTQEVTDSLDLLAAADLPLYITEFDVRGVNNDPDSQLQRYQTVFPAIWEHPSVQGVTLWGYIQGSTWRPDLGIVEANGTERPAMTWLMDYISTYPPSP